MVWMRLLVVFAARVDLLTAADRRLDFLGDFFRARNVAISANLCHGFGEWKKFANVCKNRLILVLDDHLHIPTENYFNYHVLDTKPDCLKTWKFLEQVNKTDLFRWPDKFLLLVDEGDVDNLAKQLSSYSIHVDSSVVIATFRQSDGSVKLDEVYKVHREGRLIWEDVGVWNPKTGLHERLLPPKASRRKNLRRTRFPINIQFEDNDTLNYIDGFRRPTVDTMAKQNYGSVNALIEVCNVSSNMIITPRYGYLNATTNTFDGIIGDLAAKKTIFSASSMLFTKERLAVVDFIKLMNPQDIRFILRRPSVSYVASIYAIAFHGYVWLSLFAVALLLCLANYVILNVEKEVTFGPKRLENLAGSDAILISLEAICQQGTLIEPKSYSGRTLFFLAFMCFMLIYVSYAGNIVVLLQSTRPMTTPEELLNSPLDAGAMNTSYMRFYLTSGTEPVRRELYARKIGPTGYYTMEEGMRRVRDGYFAFHCEIATAYYYAQAVFSEQETCSLQRLDGYIPVNLGYMPMQKRSPYRKILKVGLLKIDEHGIHQRHFQRFTAWPKCYGLAPSFKSVGVIDVYQAYWIFGCGIALSLLVLLLETLTNKLKSRRPNIVRLGSL